MQQAFDVIFALDQLQEIATLTHRPFMQRFRTSARNLDAITRLLQGRGSLVTGGASAADVRDPNDAHILAAAITGEADYLVTGDRDLLVLAGTPELGRLRIVTPAEFLAMLNEPAE